MPNPRPFPFLALVITLCHALAPSSLAQKAEVSRKPPTTYAESLEALLTPLETALELSKKLKPNEDFGGAVILSEILHHVDDSGARVIAIHSIYRADSDGGAESLHSDTQSFRSASQKIHLALARTISPDGTLTAVRKNAALIQSPQRSANQSLYSDTQELLVVYPKIKPGTLTESIIVIEEDAMRVPGEFMTSATWSAGWPQGLRRIVIDVPAELGARLKFSPLGSGTPEPVRTEQEDGRLRFELERRRAPGFLWEIGRPPVSQSGPTTWITSLADWEDFARWYRPLIKDRATLKPPLAAKVDEWTKDAKDQDEVIARLLRHASTDVRYTGLEFGIAGLQPYDCNEVWENQYGDCKDKSNLLRAMLAHKGIKSYLTLLNTEHAGRIEKRSPDYRQFDHAILAIERGGGKLQFCDPTIEFGEAGKLRPNDGDRDVLVIRDDQAQFVRTPAVSAGRVHYDFDLELDDAGELSGWLTLEAKDYYATSYGSAFSKKDPQAQKRSIAGIIIDFFPTAEVVDVEADDAWDGGDYNIRAYFVVPGSDRSKLSLSFPQSDVLFPDLGDSKERLAPYYGWADHISVDATVSVPEGAGSPREIPAPLSVDSSAIKGNASWKAVPEKGNAYRAQLDVVVKKPLLSAEEFQVAFGAVNSMRSWLSTALIFEAGRKAPLPAERAHEKLDNFPLMPTAEGQLKLVDQRFPLDGNRAQRRAALAKVVQFFPNDPKTKFTVESRLAELDWNDDKNPEAITRLNKLLNSAASDAVDEEEIAWAEYLLAFAFRDSGKKNKAGEHFREIAENGNVSEFRRGWAGYQLISILKDRESPNYEKLAAETNAFIDLETEARPFLTALYAGFMTRCGKQNELQARLDALIDANPEDLGETLELLASAARELPAEQMAQLTKVLRKLPINNDNPAKKKLITELDSLERFSESSLRYATIQERLREFVEKNKPDNWDREPAGNASKSAAILDELEESNDQVAYLLHAAQHLTTHPPGERFPYFLWRMSAWAEYASRSGQSVFKTSALPTLLDLCDQLPKDDDYYVEGRFLRARNLGAKEKFAEEASIYKDLEISGVLKSDAFIIANLVRHGNALERQGKFDEANALYFKTRTYSGNFALADDGLMRAALISLELGERGKAKQVLKWLAKVSPETLALTKNGAQIKSMTDLKKPDAYWDATAIWWPQWQALLAELAPDIKNKTVRVAEIGDLRTYGLQMRKPLQAKDAAGFYDRADLLVRALRWSPEYLNDACSTLTFLAPSLNPEKSSKFRKLVIAICESFPDPSPDNLRRQQLYHSLALLDSARPEEVLPIIEKFFDAKPVLDPLFYSMNRIRAIASMRVEGTDLETPAKGLEQVLAGTHDDVNRPQNIVNLANLYRRLKRSEDEEALLARELENPLIKSNKDVNAELTSRHESLAREGTGARSFTAATVAWSEAHAPAWLEYCHPLSLEAPRVGDDLELALREAGSRFSEEESIKLHLLAASSKDLDLRKREQAFLTAYGSLINDARTFRAARTMLNTVLDQEGFPSSLKQIALFSSIDDALNFRRAGDIAFVLSHPALDRDNEAFAPMIETYGHLASANFDSPESILATIEKLTAGEQSNVEHYAVMRLFQYLIELGDLPSAEAVYKASGKWKLGADVRGTSTAIKLKLLKALKFARKNIPITRSLHQQLAPLLPLGDAAEPEWYPQRRHRLSTQDLSIAATRAMRMFQIKEKRYDQSDPSFWFDVADAIQSPESLDFSYKLLEIYLNEIDDDARRSGAAFYAPGIVDTDEPEVRARLKKIFAHHRDDDSAPLTRDAIRLYEIRTEKLRSPKSPDVDIGEAFSNITHPSANRIQIRAKLTQLIQLGDKAKLRQYLERMSADHLLDEDYLDLTLLALPLAGLDDEAELAAETAKELIPTIVAQGWRDPDSGQLGRAYELATLLKDPTLIPAAVFEDLTQNNPLRHERHRLMLEMTHHRLHQDWPKLESAASKAIELFPTFYRFYLEHARALHHQGKTDGAQVPLKVYLEFSHDEVETVDARRWLKK